MDLARARLISNFLAVRVGGVQYTVKDGIIYDVKKLLEDVRQMVAKAKQERGGY